MQSIGTPLAGAYLERRHGDCGNGYQLRKGIGDCAKQFNESEVQLGA